MLNYKLRNYIQVMVAAVAMFASVHVRGEIVNGENQPAEGLPAEFAYVDVGSDDTIVCTAVEPGYALLEELDLVDDEATTPDDFSSSLVEVEVNVYWLQEGELPTLIDYGIFDSVDMASVGHDSLELGPFQTTLPDEQIVTFTNKDEVRVVILENTDHSDVHIDCTVFELDDSQEIVGSDQGATKQVVKKKRKVKKKITKKRKVRKQVAKKKAAAKKRRKVPPRKKKAT